MAAQVRLSSTAASLAEGLLQRIFEAEANEQPVLSLEELARAEAVCKRWRGLLRTKPLRLKAVELKGEGNEREMVKALWVADRAPQVQRVVLTLDALPTPPLLVAVSFALKALLSGGAKSMAVRCSIEGGLQPYLPVISSSGQQLESLYIFCGDDDDDEALEGLDIPGSQGAASGASGSAAAANSASQDQGRHSSGGSEGVAGAAAAPSSGAAGEGWDSSEEESSEEEESSHEVDQQRPGVGLVLLPALGVHLDSIRELWVLAGAGARVQINLPMPNLETLFIEKGLSSGSALGSAAPVVVLGSESGMGGGPLFPRLTYVKLVMAELRLDASTMPALEKLELFPCGGQLHVQGLRGCTQLTSLWLQPQPLRIWGICSNFMSRVLMDASPSLRELCLDLYEPPDLHMALALSSLTQLTALVLSLYSPVMFAGPGSRAWPFPCRLLGRMRQLRVLLVEAAGLDDADVLCRIPSLQDLAVPLSCLRQLPALPQLTRMRLGALPSRLQQEDLEHLAAMQLRCLMLVDEVGKMPGEGAGRGDALRGVREALPGCEVVVGEDD